VSQSLHGISDDLLAINFSILMTERAQLAGTYTTETTRFFLENVDNYTTDTLRFRAVRALQTGDQFTQHAPPASPDVVPQNQRFESERGEDGNKGFAEAVHQNIVGRTPDPDISSADVSVLRDRPQDSKWRCSVMLGCEDERPVLVGPSGMSYSEDGINGHFQQGVTQDHMRSISRDPLNNTVIDLKGDYDLTVVPNETLYLVNLASMPRASEEDQKMALKALTCPLTGELLKEPVMILETGITVSRDALDAHFESQASGPFTCPVTHKQLKVDPKSLVTAGTNGHTKPRPYISVVDNAVKYAVEAVRSAMESRSEQVVYSSETGVSADEPTQLVAAEEQEESSVPSTFEAFVSQLNELHEANGMNGVVALLESVYNGDEDVFEGGAFDTLVERAIMPFDDSNPLENIIEVRKVITDSDGLDEGMTDKILSVCNHKLVEAHREYGGGKEVSSYDLMRVIAKEYVILGIADDPVLDPETGEVQIDLRSGEGTFLELEDYAEVRLNELRRSKDIPNGLRQGEVANTLRLVNSVAWVSGQFSDPANVPHDSGPKVLLGLLKAKSYGPKPTLGSVMAVFTKPVRSPGEFRNRVVQLMSFLSFTDTYRGDLSEMALSEGIELDQLMELDEYIHGLRGFILTAFDQVMASDGKSEDDVQKYCMALLDIEREFPDSALREEFGITRDLVANRATARDWPAAKTEKLMMLFNDIPKPANQERAHDEVSVPKQSERGQEGATYTAYTSEGKVDYSIEFEPDDLGIESDDSNYYSTDDEDEDGDEDIVWV
jgi:hypothetical protein